MPPESHPLSSRRFTLTGIMVYVAMWGLIFGLFRLLSIYSDVSSQYAFPYGGAIVGEIGIALALGLSFIAIGIAVAYLIGKNRNFRSIVFISLSLGVFAIAFTFAVGLLLRALGVIEAN